MKSCSAIWASVRPGATRVTSSRSRALSRASPGCPVAASGTSSPAVMTANYLLLARTSFGLRVRAALESPSLARASGISTRTMYSVTFTLGAALGGLAGALMVPLLKVDWADAIEDTPIDASAKRLSRITRWNFMGVTQDC